MAFDAFLKMDGIDGESQDKDFPGSIEVSSFSWGVSNAGQIAGGGGGGTGRATFTDMRFGSSTSKASPLLAKACATGQHIKKAVLHVRKAGEQQFEFIQYTMEDVLVSSYFQGGAGGGDERPTDEFTLSFAQFEFDYIPQNPDGSKAPPVVFTFDVLRNTT